MTPICLTVQEAAEAIGMSPSVLRSYIDAGLLPVIKFPSTKHQNETSRRVLVSVEDLRAFVERCRVTEPTR
jgi:predicted site-specific integrase-resolvase